MLHIFILFIIFLPILWILLYTLIRNEAVRDIIKWAGFVTMVLSAVYIGIKLYGNNSSIQILRTSYSFDIEFIFKVCILAVAAYSTYLAFRSRVIAGGVISLLQIVLLVFLEIYEYPGKPAVLFHIDFFSFSIYALFAVAGGSQLVTCSKYMKKYFQQKDLDHSGRTYLGNGFFFLAVGLAGLVFTRHLLWIYLFWQIITLGQIFLTAGPFANQTKDRLRQIFLKNMASSFVMLVFIVLYHSITHTMEFGWGIVSKNMLPGLLVSLLLLAVLFKGWSIPFDRSIDYLLKMPTPIVSLVTACSLGNVTLYFLFNLRVLFSGNASKLVSIYGAIVFIAAMAKAVSTYRGRHLTTWISIAFNGLFIFYIFSGSGFAISSLILLMIAYTLAISLVYMCLSATEYRTGTQNMEKMHFLMRDMPNTASYLSISISMFIFFPLVGSLAGITTVYTAGGSLISMVLLIIGFVLGIICWLRWLLIILILPDSSMTRVEENPLIYRVGIPVMGLLVLAANISLGIIYDTSVRPYINNLGISSSDIDFWYNISIFHGGSGVIYLFGFIMLMVLVSLLAGRKRGTKVNEIICTCGETYQLEDRPQLFSYSLLVSEKWMNGINTVLRYLLIANIILIFGVTL